MDKNMINIDELLQQRLGNAEEPLRSGAWANMSELLDKEMPDRKVPVAAANWRRMFAYVAGIVILLVALSVGGYEMLESFNSGSGIADNTNNTMRKPTATSGLAGSAINALPETKPAEDQATNEEQVIDEQAVANNNSNNNTNTTTNTTKSNNNTHNKANTYSSAAGNTTKPVTANNNMQEVATTNNNNTTPPAKPVANKPAATTTKQANNTTEATAGNNGTEQPKPAKAEATGNNNSNVAAKANNRKEAAPAEMSTSDMQPTEVNTGAAVAKQNFKEEEIPYRKIERKQRIEDGVAKMDTIYNGEDVLTVRKPLDNEPAVAAKQNNDELASGSNIAPAAAANAGKNETKEEDVVMQKLGDNRVSRKKMKNYNPNRFEEMVKNAKYRFGAVKFYPGIVGGVNAAFNGNYGFHLGAALNTSISERWSIISEVKFVYRWNGSNENMQDFYIDNVKTANVNGQAVTTYDSIDYSYNFTDYFAIEAPILVNYSSKRFNYMAGVNLVYNFPITSIEGDEKIHVSETPNISTNNRPFATDKQVLLTDFSSNFNIGPMVGFGYKASPAVKLDLRATIPVWSNASSTGQKEIAKRLYNQPQVQFNINYRFSSNKFKPYKRNQ